MVLGFAPNLGVASKLLTQIPPQVRTAGRIFSPEREVVPHRRAGTIDEIVGTKNLDSLFPAHASTPVGEVTAKLSASIVERCPQRTSRHDRELARAKVEHQRRAAHTDRS